jgi:hypothetical protein
VGAVAGGSGVFVADVQCRAAMRTGKVDHGSPLSCDAAGVSPRVLCMEYCDIFALVCPAGAAHLSQFTRYAQACKRLVGVWRIACVCWRRGGYTAWV